MATNRPTSSHRIGKRRKRHAAQLKKGGGRRGCLGGVGVLVVGVMLAWVVIG